MSVPDSMAMSEHECPECKSIQRPPQAVAPLASRPLASLPDYKLASAMGYVLITLGLAACGIALLVIIVVIISALHLTAYFDAKFEDAIGAVVCGLTGILVMGVGALCFCIRDMAVNSFAMLNTLNRKP